MRKMMFVLAAQAVAAAAGLSAEPPRPAVAPIVPCPPTFATPTLPCPPGAVAPGTMMPGVPGTMPGTPGMPGTPPGSPGVPPVTPPVPDVTSPTPDTSGAFARQSEGGTQAGRSYAPNMFGDVLGARSIRVGVNTPFSIRNAAVGGTQQTATGIGRTVDLNGATVRFGGGTSGIPLSDPITIRSNNDLTFVQPTSADGLTADTTFTRSALQTLLSNGGLTPAQIASFNQLTAAQREQLLRNRGQINQTLTERTQGIAIRTLTVSPITAGSLAGGSLNADGELVGEQAVPLPGGSTYVGRVKMSEDTSPLPRDRFIFAYDHFDSVPFIPGGLTVNRFQFGVEKTFFDGRWSAEVRLPFAGTLASTNVQGFEVAHTELGNIRFALKRIFSQNDVLTTTSGVAVTLPTADDQVLLNSLNGRELYRFKNESVTVEPFVAALFTPNSRLFSQTWASINFDVSGGELTYDQAAFGGSGRERIWDLPFLSVDYQVGYWLIQQDYGTLRGLAPFVELHWNYAIAQQELINEVNKRLPNRGLSVGSVADHELNLIAGVLTQVGDNLNLSIGASAPLLNRPNRTFDAQVGVRANYLFGRTARARNPINYINSY